MRLRMDWNEDWQYTDTFTEELLTAKTTEHMETVRLPHTVAVTPLHYFDEGIYQKLCGYVKCFYAEEAWRGKRVLLTFFGAAHAAEVFLNGEKIAEHRCGYTAFTVDMAPKLRFGEENRLVVKLDSRETLDIPPFGYVIDYMTYGGLYREVLVEITEQTAIEDVFVKTKRISKKEYSIKPEVSISNRTEDCLLRFMLTSEKETVIAEWTQESKQEMTVSGIQEWHPEHPVLYTLRTELLCKNEAMHQNEVIDVKETRIGFREAAFKADGFHLNGKKYKIRGLNRHQSYPYVGYAMPESIQKYDADILKSELGVNAVRTSHYPQSQHFIDRCDELGLLVFTEIPGWQHIGEAKWKEQVIENTEEMVAQYRNHPSIILWGVRINESQDDDELYQKTNAVAHRLDDTRQTSGVRFLQKSHLLEDVYAYNDFLHDGSNDGCSPKKNITSDMEKGYLISEYNGHMYPTKSFDSEEHRTEHLLRHARVMDAYYQEADIAGGFGWCMSDYNTHQDFGSGDRICYHGVTDMFRNRKPAGYVYSSQQEREPVLFISSAMDIGEHPACLMKDVYAVTNADSVRVYKNDTFIREYTKKETPFQNLPHGPICMDDFIGDQMMEGEGFDRKKSEEVKQILLSACKNGMDHLPLSTKLLAAKCIVLRGMRMQDAVTLYNKYVGNWGGTATSYRFDAIKDGNIIASVEKKPVKAVKLSVTCSHTDLHEKATYDVAALRIQAVSEEGNVLAFLQEPIEITTKGAIELIGPSVISLGGGMGGTYVKSCGKSGAATVTLRGESFAPVTITFSVEGGQNGQEQ